MTWSPYSLSNLNNVDDAVAGTLWTWSGASRWLAPTTTCPLYTVFLGVTGFRECRVAGGVPDTDALAVATSAADADLVSVEIAFALDGYAGGAEPSQPCLLEGEHQIGLTSGGCNVADTVDPHIEIYDDLRGRLDLAGIDLGARIHTFTSPEAGGNWFVVNPSPVTYSGMDPDNDANVILFEIEDLPSHVWFHFPPPAAVASAAGNFSVIVHYYKLITDTDEPVPVGTITGGDPISGVIRRKVHT